MPVELQIPVRLAEKKLVTALWATVQNTWLDSRTDGEAHFTMRGATKSPWTSAKNEPDDVEPATEDQGRSPRQRSRTDFRMERLIDGRWASKYMVYGPPGSMLVIVHPDFPNHEE